MKSSDHRNLDGIYTDVFGVAYGKKSLGEIFLKKLLTQEIICNSGRQQIKSLRKSQLKMRSSSSLLGRGLFWIAYGSNFWSSEDRVRARFHYAESRQNKP